MMHGKKFVAGGESEEADDDGRLGGGALARACKQAGGSAGMGSWAFSSGQIENGTNDTIPHLKCSCVKRQKSL